MALPPPQIYQQGKQQPPGFSQGYKQSKGLADYFKGILGEGPMALGDLKGLLEQLASAQMGGLQSQFQMASQQQSSDLARRGLVGSGFLGNLQTSQAATLSQEMAKLGGAPTLQLEEIFQKRAPLALTAQELVNNLIQAQMGGEASKYASKQQKKASLF